MKIIQLLCCLLTTLLSVSIVQANCLILPTSLENRVDDNELVVEAQVIDKYSYWGKDQTKIFTAHKLMVYKLFKGTLATDELLLITEGGIVGDMMQEVFPSLTLNVGQIGIFILNQAHTSKLENKSNYTAAQQYYATEVSQGFVEYDLHTAKAKGAFENYDNIQASLYKRIQQTTKKTFEEMNYLQIVNSSKTQDTQEQSNKDAAMAPDVQCLYPQYISSGTETILTIYGDNFGSLTGSSKIELRNPDTGGQTYIQIPNDNIVSWTNTTIELTLPTKVGSGPIKVTSNGGTTTSTEEVYIVFSRSNAGSTPGPTVLANENGLGGYTLKYSTNSNNGGVNFSNSPAKAPFERAITTLRSVGFNITASGTTNKNTYGDDGENVVMFDNDAQPLGAPVGLLFAQYKKCGGNWEVTGMDVVFRRHNSGSPVVNWNFSTGFPYSTLDFESVAVHEVMHGVQLKHVLNSEAVMYFAYGYNSMRREPVVCDDIAGCMHVVQESLLEDAYCDQNKAYELPSEFVGYQQYDFSSCPTSLSCGTNGPDYGPRFYGKVLLEGLLTDNSIIMDNSLYMTDLLPSSQPFNKEPWNYNGTESMNSTANMPSNAVDWIFLELRSESDESVVIAQKAALLTEDGNIISVDGTPGVSFDGNYSDQYYIAVHHATHLSIATRNPVSLTDNSDQVYDFTNSVNKAMGTQQLKAKNGRYVLYSGDYDGNGIINNIDFNLWGSNNAIIGQYVSWDGDGNGVVNNHDYNLWTQNKSKVGIDCIQY